MGCYGNIMKFRVMEILWSFRLALEGKTGKEIPESSRLEFLEKFLGNIFALSDAEDNNSSPLNRGNIADLPFLRKVLAICQNSWEPHFWDLMDSLVLVAYASLAALRTLLQQLLSKLYFGFRRFILLVPKKKWFLWDMAAALPPENHGEDEVWPDTYDKG